MRFEGVFLFDATLFFVVKGRPRSGWVSPRKTHPH